MKTTTAVLFAAILALAGCATQQFVDKEQAAQVAAGRPPEYAKGYADGWSSGLAAGGNTMYQTIKDVNRYLSDPKYKLGWDDGYRRWRGRD